MGCQPFSYYVLLSDKVLRKWIISGTHPTPPMFMSEIDGQAWTWSGIITPKIQEKVSTFDVQENDQRVNNCNDYNGY